MKDHPSCTDHLQIERAKPDRSLSRRRFLKGVSAAAIGLAVAGCRPGEDAEASSSTTGQSLDQVAIAQAQTYDRDLVRQQVLFVVQVG